MTAFFVAAAAVCMIGTLLYMLVMGAVQGLNDSVSDAEGRPIFVGMCLSLIFFVLTFVAMFFEDRR